MMEICHGTDGEYIVRMHGFEIFRTNDKAYLIKFVVNVVSGWK